MLFKSSIHILIYSSVLFIIINSKRLKREASNYAPKCKDQDTPVDQIIDIYNQTKPSRKKRFVLFPEFVLWRGQWEYLQNTKDFLYWVANFYPDRIDNDYIRLCINDIVKQINTVLNDDITVQEAKDPGEANFHYNFFDYTKCPMDKDSKATIENITILDTLYIYPVELTRKNRYRAHGGIHLVENNRAISTIKFNMQQTFIHAYDFVYDPIIYTCDDEKNECEIDVHWVLLHETLHGFGIEHTANNEKPTPPNPKMQSVMHFSPLRILCHDDIRAIRAVYKLPVKRENAVHDDTCRRDFPMNPLQKLMYRIGRLLPFIFIGLLIISFTIFILTLIYLLIRYLLSKQKFEKQPSRKSIVKTSKQPRGYLWHDDMI